MTEPKLPAEAAQAPFNYGVVLLPKFSSLTLSSLIEPLRIANYCDGQQRYKWTYLSVDGVDVPGCSGYSVATEGIASAGDAFDAIIVCGGWNAERYDNPDLERWLRTMARKRRVIGAAEMGSYVLAKAGLLNGYSATIHWHCHNAFRERYPEIELVEQLYVIDRNRTTCAGGIACLDMMLHDISTRYGNALAAEVADQVVYGPSREAVHSQIEKVPAEQTAVPQVLRRAVELMEANVERTIKIPQLSRTLNLSQRKLERLFNKHYGCSAVAFYRRVRLLRARVLLTQTDMSVLDICVACGFASSSYFSKSYAEQFGVRPRDHRLAWPDSRDDPLWPGLNTQTHNT
jgi:transcriptional regulator GlxA family with amidase domain